MSHNEISGYKVSPLQQMVWNNQKRHSRKYYLKFKLLLEGAIDLHVLQLAIQKLCAKQEILNTKLNCTESQKSPLQYVSEKQFEIEVVEVYPEKESELNRSDIKIDTIFENLSDQDLEQSPVFKIIKKSKKQTVLLAAVSGLFFDFCSVKLFTNQLVIVYKDILMSTNKLSELTFVQYLDYSEWASSLVLDSEYQVERNYWNNKLADKQLETTFEKTNQYTQSSVVEYKISRIVQADILNKLNDVSTSTQVSIEILLYAIWNIVLHRSQSNNNIVTGFLHAGRLENEIQNTLGFFEKYLPISSIIDEQMTFSSYVVKLREMIQEHIAYSSYFNGVSLAGGEDDIASEQLSYIPVVYSFRNVGEIVEGNGFSIIVSAIEDQLYPVDFQLQCASSKQNMEITLKSNSAKYSQLVSELLLNRFMHVLETINDVGSTIAELSILPITEISTINRFSNQDDQVAIEHDLVKVFEDQVKLTPKNVAIKFGNESYTYSDLNNISNQLSLFLANKGVNKGDFVPLLLSRSAEAVVSMLGILKLGATMVPIDTKYTRSRISTVLLDLDCKFIITQRPHLDKIEGCTVEKIIAEDIQYQLNTTEQDHQKVNIEPGNLAYMLYTSGTTGEPQGVQVTHSNLVNYLFWAKKEYDLGGIGALFCTSIGFDLTITSLFLPLISGLTVTVISEAEDIGILNLAEHLASEIEVGLLKITPSQLTSISKYLDTKNLKANVTTIIVGGERLSSKVVSSALRSFPEARIYNEYGPTETTIGCSCFEFSKEQVIAGQVPIGRPIDNTTIYLLDENLKPVPIGCEAEIYIGGKGVAPGYYKNVSASVDKFINNPFEKKGKLYKTGDYGRYLNNGVLMYSGRKDAQVKLRGYRIELGEIESKLLQMNVGDEVACVLANDSTEIKQIIAFYVSEQQLNEVEVKQSLAAKLPPYMIPDRYIKIDRLPMTVHGKIDRLTLAKNEKVNLRYLSSYVAAKDEIEETLVSIWIKVLGISEIGVCDNYFSIGGDSIRSINIAGEAQNMGLDISVGDIHRYVTIREMAQAIRAKKTANISMPGTSAFSMITEAERALVMEDVEAAYPLNLLQEGMIYHRAFAAKSAVYHAMLGIRLKMPLHLEIFEKVIQETVNRHPSLRTSFDLKTFTRPIQLVHMHYRNPLKFYDLTACNSAEQHEITEQWICDEKKRGFDIDEYPLIRFVIHLFSEDTLQLTLSYHHEIIDGWSESMLISQLLDQYMCILHNKPFKVKKPSSEFRDSILLEQMSLESMEFKDFWSNYIKDATFMRLPRLIEGPKADKGEREIIKVYSPFSDELSQNVKQLSVRLGVPLKSVLLAAHMVVIGRYGGVQDVLTHMVSNGRPETPGSENLVGLFVNSFTFRLNLKQSSWKELIYRTFKGEQESISYRRYPMAELKRHQGRDPLSEVLFFLIDYHVYQGLEKWEEIELLEHMFYGESTFPYCSTFKVDPFTELLSLQIEYDSLQFSEELVDSMIQCYGTVFLAMTSNVDAQYYASCLQSPVERKLIDKWNSKSLTVADIDHHNICELLFKQIEMNPTAIALKYQEQEITYKKFGHRVTRCAAYLQENGVNIETPVGIYMPRSIDMLISIYAVLLAGGCYVPMELDTKMERMESIIEEAGIKLVLTSGDHLFSYEIESIRTLSLNENWKVISSGNNKVHHCIKKDNLAYIIYTSGSTGKPKGVAITHSNLIASTLARNNFYQETVENFMLLSPIAFDSSIVGIFWPLSSGATLVLPEEGLQREISQLCNIIEKKEITHVLMIPSLYAAMLDYGEHARLKNLKTVIVAGEVCTKELLDQHKSYYPETNFYNEYGPSEATVWSTAWSSLSQKVLQNSLPIGEPIAGTEIHILDSQQNVVPIGVQGEIYIGGLGLARGYIDKAKLTAEQFISDKNSIIPGARLYRTGDLGRFLSNGEIEYLGRRDNQVKVRGFRVELLDIESSLDNFPGIQKSIVQTVDINGEKEIIAYVRLDEGDNMTEEQVTEIARDRLPKYMVPKYVMILKAFPVTKTGKVDRRAMPEPERNPGTQTQVTASTPTEKVIAGVWSDVLQIDIECVDDDFFDLGGESLRAMRILAQINKVFDLDIAVSVLMEEKTSITKLAELVDLSVWAKESKIAPENQENLIDEGVF